MTRLSWGPAILFAFRSLIPGFPLQIHSTICAVPAWVRFQCRYPKSIAMRRINDIRTSIPSELSPYSTTNASRPRMLLHILIWLSNGISPRRRSQTLPQYSPCALLSTPTVRMAVSALSPAHLIVVSLVGWLAEGRVGPFWPLRVAFVAPKMQPNARSGAGSFYYVGRCAASKSRWAGRLRPHMKAMH